MGLPQTKSEKPAQKSKTVEKTPAASVADLVLQGKTADAVKLAGKSPLAAAGAMKTLMATSDSQIAQRKTTEAQATLDAAQKFLEACDKAGTVKDLPREALKGRQFRLQGIQLSNQGDYAKAEAFLRQALQISKDVKDPVLEMGIHHNLGYALQSMDLLEEATKEYDAALQMAEVQKDDLRAGITNFNLGETLYRLKRLDAAMAAYKRAAEKSKASSQPDIVAMATRKQAVVLAAQDPRNAEAVRTFQEAESMFEKLGDNQNAGWTYFLLADTYAYAMNFRQAAETGEKALTFLTKADNKASLQRCYELLSDMYGRLGDIPKSEKFKKDAQNLEIKK